MNLDKGKGKSIAIMQPTFLPWIGYFALIERVDEFVILDHVQYEKRGWQQRNKIKTPSGQIWLSVPVKTKGRQFQKINDTEILYDGKRGPLDKIMYSIKINYSKAPFYKDYIDDLIRILCKKHKYLCNLNLEIINWICEKLNVKRTIILSSKLDVSGTKAELLVDICKKLNANHYISPLGSKIYLEKSNSFRDAKISLSYHEYNHPIYSQLYKDFIPYMSIIDLLFNVGPDSLEVMLKVGCNK